METMLIVISKNNRQYMDVTLTLMSIREDATRAELVYSRDSILFTQLYEVR